MKNALTLAAAMLAASPAMAALIPFHGVLPGAPGKRDTGRAGKISERAACNEDNVLRALQNPTRSVGASSFCSAYIQPTTVITATATISQTTIITTTSTATVSVTDVTTSSSTVATVTCAATSTPAVTCNYPAYGFGNYLITQTAGVDSVTCHEMCLQDPNCLSFQTEEGEDMYCNTFNVPTAGNVQYAPGDIFYFFDRDCPDFLPPACTPAPSLKKRDIEARAATTPANLSTVLATVPASRISSACSCLITSAPATATVTVAASTTASTTTTTTAVVTSTGTEFDTSTAFATAIVTASP